MEASLSHDVSGPSSLPFMSSPRHLPALAAALLCAPVLHALEISEILTENEGGLQDADFASPGWIELHNETAATVNPAGWRLTDDPLVLNKWTLPSEDLVAGGYLIIFTSGKNRAVSGAELHTNFQLDPDGEFLALVRPDNSIAQQFTPKFPQLRRNVSYSETTAPLTTPLVTEGAAVRYLVPANDTLGTTWTAAGFADGAWTAGTTGLGFDAAGGGAKLDFKSSASNVAIPAPAGWTGFVFSTVPESGTGPATATVSAGSITVKLDAIGGTTLAARNRHGTGADSINDLASLNNVGEDFIFSSTSSYTVGTPRGMDVTISGLIANTPYPVTVWAYDRASATNRAAVWTDVAGGASATLTFNGADGQIADDAAFNARSITLTAQSNAGGQIILQGRAAPSGHATSHNVFVNALQVGGQSFSPLIATTVSGMQGTASSLYSRSTFTVSSPSSYDQLRLRIRYDDGFFAWVNGQIIASRNAPGASAFNSVATADRNKTDAMSYEEIIVPAPPGLLTAGANVLSIHGLSQGAADIDFLLSPTLDATGPAAPAPHYFSTPTPGAVNGTAYNGIVADTSFSIDRGYFTAPFSTVITCATPGSQIRYTLDGTAPTASTGTVYSIPVNVSGITVLRAAAFFPGWIPSNTDTQSYLTVAGISGQSASPAGWPATWGTDSEVDANDLAGNGTVPANYAMDQRVVTNTIAGYGIPEALQSIPTLSIALAPADFLGANGIYQNPRSTGAAWERDCSIELIDPTSAENGFHETCRVEIHGNSSRRPWRMQKHAMRLSFKGGTGAARLRYRFFRDAGFDDINKLVLRATFTDGWGLVSWDPARYRPDDSVMMRDVWVRKSWADMGNLSPLSRYVHVVINGLYWGVYDAAEHIDQEFVSAHLGGLPADWEVVSDFQDPDASATSAWKSMFNAATAGLSTPAAYAAIQQWLDPANFADYYLLHQFSECEDWPHHNGAAYRNRITGSQYQWMAWDQEIALDNHSIDRVSAGAGNTGTPRTPGPLWQALRANAEWRLLVADRAHSLFNNGGPLSVASCQDRWMDIAAVLDKPIVAESARWGDTAVETPYGNTESRPGIPLENPYTREGELLPNLNGWLPNVNRVRDTWIPSLHNRANSYATITRLKTAGFWPNTEPPVFAAHGDVPVGYDLVITAPAGAIYYTLNGSDPRTPVTGAAAGTLYSGAIDLTVTARVKARAVTGTPGSGTEVWSALTDAQFIVGTAAGAASIAVSEICYNPPGAAAWEFIELMNISGGPVDLTGVEFTAGIAYSFAPGTLLAAGQRLVLASDAAAFAAQFPAITLHGTYTGKLDNNGEQLALTAANASDIRRFTYNDKLPWPTAADGNGHSLTLIAPPTNPDHALPQNWRASVLPNGTPGTGDGVSFAGDPGADTDGDGLTDFLEYALADPPLAAILLPGGTPAMLLTRRTAADDARVIVEYSTDLAAWSPSPDTSLVESTAPAGGMMTEAWTPPPGATRGFMRARVETR